MDETGKSNDDLQNFIAASEVATIFVDRRMCIKRFTPRAAQIFNLRAPDIGRPLPDITHSLEYAEMGADAEKVFESLRAIEREVKSKDDEWFIARLIPYRTHEDLIDGLVLTFVDVTRLHNTQARLAQEENRMRLVAASTKDYAIITQDMEGRITSWNNGARRMFGYQEEEVVGELIDIIFTPEDREHGQPKQELAAAMRDGSADDERWHIRKDGSRFFCSGATTLLKDGEMRGFAKIARDLTGNVEAESRRQELLTRETATRVQAEGASRMREEFLAILSHELKQPLNLIHLNAERLKRLPEARQVPTIQRAAETILGAVVSQATIIDDLLDLSRARTGKLTLHKTAVDLVQLVDQFIQVFSVDAQKKQITLVNETGNFSLFITADITRVEQIIWNLLSNAIKFTPAGGTINVQTYQENEQACVKVKDTGTGITPEFLPSMFDMFNQADTSNTREHGGLGIGLALVKQLAESHGGTIKAMSEGLGRGSEFVVCLPLSIKEEDKSAGSEGKSPTTLSGVSILLVDDNVENLEIFGELLEAQGASLRRAESAEQALAIAELEVFDIVVTDIAMPKMDGFQLLEKLKTIPLASKVPVVAVTGFGRMEDVERALSAGFAAHFQKPINLDSFIDIVGKLRRSS